jgi:hypothetical protein
MVDWDRVDELRDAGESWSDIAADPKVGFHPDASVGDPGRALRALYHHDRARRARQAPAPAPKRRPTRDLEQRWTLVRIGFLLVAVVGVWCALAYAAPSPVGLLVPAIPYLALILAAVAALLLFALWRTRERRWSAVFRTTVIGGLVLGLIFSGMVGVVGALVFGCPYLPPSTAVPSISTSGWHGDSGLPAWTENGKPVVYFFGAVWCPYCSASSWAIWKALTEFGTVTGAKTGYSSSTDVYPSTPEMVLAGVQLGASAPIAFQVSEYTGSVEGTAPSTSTCFQLAYVTAYSGGSIPFAVVDGKYVHGGTTIVDPANLTTWKASGAATVKNDVANETGQPWTVVQSQTWWIMAFLAKAIGTPVSVLATEAPKHWSSATIRAVNADLNATGS